MTEQAHELREGARLLDRYRIVDRVGGGGMATIHRAVDERFDRIVCVKLLRIALEGSGSTGEGQSTKNPVFFHFLREAQALSKLQHPNTLRIYDFGYIADGHRPFQVSEFLDGGNLQQHVKNRGALTLGETLAIVERITGAIAEAHGQSILHRDIKPSNILFARVGDVLIPKLADFGIAHMLMSRASRTGDEADGADSSSPVGMYSPRWAAPEQLTGGLEGPYTDVYALGLVTAFMLTGQSTFEGTTRAAAAEERAGGVDYVVRRLSKLGLPAYVSPALLRAVAPEPAVRTKTPMAFFDELRSALGGVRMTLPSKDATPQSRPSPQDASDASAPSVDSRRAAPVRPVEGRTVSIAGRPLRVVEAHEKLDLELPRGDAESVRFRVSLLPDSAHSRRIQIKGLSCFVSKVDGTGKSRPTPAISTSDDGEVDFISTKHRPLGRIAFAFARAGGDGASHVFPLPAGDVVVPSSRASFAVALDLGSEREIVILCKSD
jgi:eukaryotic-like serine/threonine-protein kinase